MSTYTRIIKLVPVVTFFCLFSFNARAQILFNGDWANYMGTFYGANGWQNGIPVGKPTGNGDWNDFQGFWSPKPIGDIWLYGTSFAKDRIRLEQDPTSPKHGMVARFEVRSGDHRPDHWGGERSEMYTMQGLDRKKLPVTVENHHEYYGIAIKVSADWLPPQKESPQKGFTKWGSFMQLHSPNVFNSPPAISLSAEEEFGIDINAGELDKTVMDVKTNSTKHTKKDSQHFNLSNGDLRKGHWVQFMLDVVWATDDTGSLQLYRRDESESDFHQVLTLSNVPTLQTYSVVSTAVGSCATCAPDNVTHYWRIGYYRSTSPDQTNVLWLGPVVRGSSFDEVAETAFGSSGSHVKTSSNYSE